MRVFLVIQLTIATQILNINCNVCITSPQSALDKFIDQDDKKGCLHYSVSTFGYMDYLEKSRYVIKMFDDVEGCEYNGPVESTEVKQTELHVAYLVKRGECTYVQKAVNVRRAGGAIALVYHDNHVEDVSNVIPISPKNIANNVPPVVLINWSDGENLRKMYQNRPDEPIKLSIDFDIEKKKDDQQHVVFWQSPTNSMSYKFLVEFYKYYSMISDYITMDVRYKIRSLPVVRPKSGGKVYETKKNSKEPNDWSSPGESSKSIKEVLKFCYGRGKYCALNDANYQYNPIESLDQVIYQSCLFDQVRESNSLFDQYFSFLNSYNRICLEPYTSKDPRQITDSLNKCFEGLIKNIKVFSYPKLNTCYESKFANPKDKFNTNSDFLHQMKSDTSLFGQNYDIVPSMFIDGNLVRGKLEAHSSLSAICDSIKTKLPFCNDLHRKLQKEIKDNYLIEQPSTSKNSLFFYLLILVSSQIVLAAIVYLFKLNFRSQLDEQIYTTIRGSISDYQKIHDMPTKSMDNDSDLKPGEVEMRQG